MGITTLNLDMTIGTIVEAMLPQFSDSRLGLLLTLNMSFDDYGFGDDGNTRVCKGKHIRLFPSLLFQRPSNYTKVFFRMPKNDAKGLDINPKWAREPLEWHLEHDHDSCWRDFEAITQLALDSWGKFKKERKQHIHEFHHLDEPSYVVLETFEQKDKMADRYSSEGRIWTIKTRVVERADLEYLRNPDQKQMFNSGLFIKGSETHAMYQKNCEYYKNKKTA